MLRRKLFMMLGPLVALLLTMAVMAIVLLQGVLEDLEHIRTKAWKAEENVGHLSQHIGEIEVGLYELQLGKARHLDSVIERIEMTRGMVAAIGGSYIVNEGAARTHYEKLCKLWPQFERHVSVLATVQDPGIAKRHNDASLAVALSLRQELLPLSQMIHEHARIEQENLVKWMRWLVLGLALVFLLVINIAVLMLVRVAGMILRPIDRLVHASRELAAEKFDHRIELDQKDEFDELARAYNHLAGELQAQEQRRLETLGHVATTLNHELNNAMSMIQLQLQLLSRRAGEGETVEKCLRRIHEGLERMADTVEALKHIKRIVLTEYVAGTKMLDLKRSTQDTEPVAGSHIEA